MYIHSTTTAHTKTLISLTGPGVRAGHTARVKCAVKAGCMTKVGQSRAQSKSKACQDEKENDAHREHSRVCGSTFLPSHSYEQLRARNRQDTGHLVPSAKEQSKYGKLKEEVVK